MSTFTVIRTNPYKFTSTNVNPYKFTVEQSTFDITDYDGNIYPTIIINHQQWMAENLRTTHYADGTPIVNLPSNADWKTASAGAYCWYDNDITNKIPYGALYNRYAIVNTHGLPPTGWRIPTVADITALGIYLGGSAIAGRKLKGVGTKYWTSPNTATNETRFNALPCGYRNPLTGAFFNLGITGLYYLLDGSATNITLFTMNYNSTSLWNGIYGYAYTYPKYGLGVRCVKDI
jgi:uncharacterized protein (TIGR02145 family)